MTVQLECLEVCVLLKYFSMGFNYANVAVI